MHKSWIRAAVLAVPVGCVASSAFGLSAGHTATGHSCPSCAGVVGAPGQGGELLTDDVGPAAPFQLQGRWTSTATNGPTGSQGTPITLTWGFLRDGITTITSGVGEPAATSSLIADFDARFGTSGSLQTRPWFRFFEESFERWEQLGGVTYNYEANDDGAVYQTNGQLGVRGDIRVGGKPIDGASNTLAYNYYPNSGEMVLDTNETTLFTSTTNDYRSLRNIITHEAGHGIGINHVDSNNANFLMEPFLATAFDGPQLDDVLAIQRNYGDVREKGNGNDNAATADSLGVFVGAGSAAVGTNGDTTAVARTDVDFLSIDDESDVDVFSFTVAPGSQVTLTLDPKGPTYNQGPQGGTQTSYNASNQSDLTLSLLGLDGTTVLDFANALGLGGTETLTETLLAGGTYYARIAGLTADVIQLYQLNLNVTLIPEPTTLTAVALAGVALRRRRRQVA